jgi:hypothetical protein
MVDIRRDAKQFKTEALKHDVAVGRQFPVLPNWVRGIGRDDAGDEESDGGLQQAAGLTVEAASNPLQCINIEQRDSNPGQAIDPPFQKGYLLASSPLHPGVLRRGSRHPALPLLQHPAT